MSDPHTILHLSSCLAFQYMVTNSFTLLCQFSLSKLFGLNAGSLKSTSPLFHIWFFKFVSSHSATGCICSFWANETTLCPCCGHYEPKTTRHVLLCPNPCICHTFQSQLLVLNNGWKLMIQCHILYCLVHRLCMAQEPLFSLCVSFHPCGPSTMDWSNLLLGQLSVDWSPLQQ